MEELTKDTFSKATSKGIVLVDFWAPWCGPCKMLMPTMETLSKEMAGKLEIKKVNVDDQQELSSQFGISSIPTLMLFKDGKPITTRVGGASKDALKKWLEPFLQ